MVESQGLRCSAAQRIVRQALNKNDIFGIRLTGNPGHRTGRPCRHHAYSVKLLENAVHEWTEYTLLAERRIYSCSLAPHCKCGLFF